MRKLGLCFFLLVFWWSHTLTGYAGTSHDKVSETLSEQPFMSQFVFHLLQCMQFPKQYEAIWQAPDAQACEDDGICMLGRRSRAMINDYIKGRFFLHLRHYTDHPVLHKFLNTTDDLSLKDILRFLATLQDEVFTKRFSREHYGFVVFNKSFFHRNPDRVGLDGTLYRRKTADPGSLYGRARFIFIQSLIELEEAAAREGSVVDQETKALVAKNFLYYFDPFIGSRKESTSASRKVLKACLFAAMITSFSHIGPLAGLGMHALMAGGGCATTYCTAALINVAAGKTAQAAHLAIETLVH